MKISCNSGKPTEEELILLRKEIYHSTKPGYVIFKDYIPQSFVDHLVTFWTRSIDVTKTHAKFQGKESIYFGCPNYYSHNGSVENLTVRNFLWNQPVDMVFHSISFSVQMLRNTLMSKPIYNEIYPTKNRCLMPRIIITKEGSPVPMHTDWGPESEDFDPSRLQATLFLTKRGKDYTEGGFCFRLNTGEKVFFDLDIEVDPGDLVIWKYNNEHGIQNIMSSKEQAGFVRMLFPQEKLHEKNRSALNNVLKKSKKLLRIE